uniref:Platelet-derived growth factor beta polypeptide a n=1 Tax=Neolamprologus brichardi TaxID=32507 RepID=A0A3Q4HGR2_NEOBR
MNYYKCLCLSQQGDPLPSSLVNLVRNSPISSVEDLKLLLQEETDAIGTHGRYIRSLVEAQPAQQAACKVRTEVMEVTRSMLDRRNANFLLWPPCVEVQRCSGCCNSPRMECVPIVTSTRYLQVIKIQYINKKPHYEKPIIPVEDHVSCRCQSLSSFSSSSPPPSSHVPRLVQPPSPKTQTSKADLHRHDDLKYNQQHYGPEEREPAVRQWQHGSYTQLVHWTQPRVHQIPQPGLPRPVSSWPSEARAEHSVMGSTQQVGHGSGFEGSREESGVHTSHSGGQVHHPDHTKRQQQLLEHQQRHQHHHHHQSHYPQQYNHGATEDRELRTQYRLDTPQSDSASPPASQTEPPKFEETSTLPLTTIQKDFVTSQKSIEVTNHKQAETETASQKEGNEREESGSANSGDSATTELANQGKKKDSNVTGEDGHLTEAERRQKLLELVQREPNEQTHLHPLHPHQRPKPTTFKTGTVQICVCVCLCLCVCVCVCVCV